MPNRNQGFTLIELLITLSIVVIAIALAVPAMADFVARNRQQALMHEVQNALHNVRAQAIMQSRTIEICGSSDGQDCSASWGDGWLVRTLSGKILRLTQLASHDDLRWQGFGQSIRFHGNGTSPTGNGRFYQCHKSQVAWQLILSRQGRLRQGTATENANKSSLCH
jgi:type IV fimbrial biogenesis protein FimT